MAPTRRRGSLGLNRMYGFSVETASIKGTGSGSIYGSSQRPGVAMNSTEKKETSTMPSEWLQNIHPMATLMLRPGISWKIPMITVYLGSGSGMKSNHNFILGISSDERVVLDFDDTDFKTVDYWANRALNWHNLGGYLILKSSAGHYHVVFNRSVDWSENMRVVAGVAYLSCNEGLQRWHRMQCIKMKSTLRIGPKNEKKSPRIVKRVGEQDEQIKEFIEIRNEIKNILNNLTNCARVNQD